MQVVHTLEAMPLEVTKSIFLAGPSKKLIGDDKVPLNWRDDALRELAKAGYDGVVYIPEFRDPKDDPLYDDKANEFHRICEWEEAALNRADCILLWMDRNDSSIGAISNAEFGSLIDSGRLWYGRPDDAVGNEYLDHHADKRGMPLFSDLPNVIESMLYYIGKGEKRSMGLEMVPLAITRSEQFQVWYENLRSCGNELRGFKIKTIIHFRRESCPQGMTFAFAAHVAIYVKAEDRIKNNEWIFSRTPVSYVVTYYIDPITGEFNYVLVKEFRSPANNPLGYVYEHPGGSSDGNEEAVVVAAKELHEEIGLEIDPERLNCLGDMATFATMLTNRVNLYSVALTSYEWKKVVELAESKTILGENEGERITLEVVPESKLLSYPVDLCTIGAVHLNKLHLSQTANLEDFNEG